MAVVTIVETQTSASGSRRQRGAGVGHVAQRDDNEMMVTMASHEFHAHKFP